MVPVVLIDFIVALASVELEPEDIWDKLDDLEAVDSRDDTLLKRLFDDRDAKDFVVDWVNNCLDVDVEDNFAVKLEEFVVCDEAQVITRLDCVDNRFKDEVDFASGCSYFLTATKFNWASAQKASQLIEP
ncbi:hypothetical protein BKA65DRAFT_481180 [Rhexocercosporidium sp. MPI-PUGE-AT-0058]|nr:hypothetical protein BKA65DRAFT_481180 [Rhexocercosporidium sp. MPI-PUGE-AT-0058]